MKLFEFAYLCAKPFLPYLHNRVRRQLLKVAKAYPYPPDLLDVGGRKSHYTIGLPVNLTIIDLPRINETQKRLNLGINQGIIAQTYARRSNLRNVMVEDMTRTSLPDCAFDCVVAVEVLEHVEEDVMFVQQAHRVLKPGGIFLMTTPNGDFVKNTNPDHKRHYKREQLYSLLSRHFPDVEVEYAIQGGVFRTLGLRGWSVRRPIRTLNSMVGNFVNTIQSRRETVKHQAKGTHHLIAMAKK